MKRSFTSIELDQFLFCIPQPELSLQSTPFITIFVHHVQLNVFSTCHRINLAYFSLDLIALTFLLLLFFFTLSFFEEFWVSGLTLLLMTDSGSRVSDLTVLLMTDSVSLVSDFTVLLMTDSGSISAIWFDSLTNG